MDTDRAREILGVASGADHEDIEAAYREQVKACHPDVTDDPDAADKFRQVQEAKETLERFRQRSDGRSGSQRAGARRDRRRSDPTERGEQTGSGSRYKSWGTGRSRSAATRSSAAGRSETADAGGESESRRTDRSRRNNASRRTRTARPGECDPRGTGRSASAAGRANQWVNPGTDGTQGESESQRSSRRSQRESQHRQHRSTADPSEAGASDTEQAGSSLWVRAGKAVAVASVGYISFLVALVGAASVLPAAATTMIFGAWLVGLAWAGHRLPLSTTGMVSLLGLSVAGVLPVGGIYREYPVVSTYSPLGIDLVLALPITAAAAGFVYGVAKRGGEQMVGRSVRTQ